MKKPLILLFTIPMVASCQLVAGIEDVRLTSDGNVFTADGGGGQAGASSDAATGGTGGTKSDAQAGGAGGASGASGTGGAGGGTCQCETAEVCCPNDLPCAGECVPDCRLGGACPTQLTCDPESGVCVP